MVTLDSSPTPAGGPVDVVGRLLAERMRESLGQPVLIENVAGASGSIAVGKVARAAGDGYTIVIGNWATFVVNGAIFPLQYDLITDFEPIGLITTQPYLIVARKTMPADDLKGLVTENTALTEEVKRNTDLLEEIHRHLVALTPELDLGPDHGGPAPT